MKDSPWTEAKVVRMRELWDAGMSSGKMEKELGISRYAIVSKSKRLKLARRPNPVKPGTARPKAPLRREALRDTLPPLAKLWRPDE